jgi:arginine exporter protein ArgO
LIIFLFIGLFAHFNFFAGDKDITTHIVGLCSIIVGALIWWITLTLIVSKLRNKFTTDTIWTINKVMGSILIIICIIGVVLSLIGITI